MLFPNWSRFPESWPEGYDMLQRYRPYIHVRLVTWKPPQLGWIKCSSDGASKGNPGKSYYGFCVRDCLGDILYAESNYIGVATNMIVEARATKEGLIYCVTQGFQHVELEVDSLSPRNFLIKLKIPWEIIELVEDIFTLMESCNIQITHTLRGNQLADFIANTAMQTDEKQTFMDFHSLPSLAKKILNIDKQGLPPIRIRPRSNSKLTEVSTTYIQRP